MLTTMLEQRWRFSGGYLQPRSGDKTDGYVPHSVSHNQRHQHDYEWELILIMIIRVGTDIDNDNPSGN